jgi:myo-inositol-1(or 4)-monophosphatase
VDPLAFITTLARDAGALLRERIDDPREIAQKSPRDLVTDADRASEELIVKRIRAAFPTAAILGEESGSHPGSGDERFIVDPLDGTTNYAHRYPLFCVSIGYERGGVLEAGAIYAPVFGDLYAARRGEGATCNGRPIRVSTTASVAEAMVCTGFHPARYERNGAYFAALSRKAQAVRRDGSAALDLAFVAAGRFDAFWEWDLKPWDVAAGAVIVAEAGGRVGALTGGALDIADGSILASNGSIHDEMETLLGEVHAGG